MAAAQVISVSRRTDIAAFYSEWFLNRLQAGFARYRNPFGGQLYEVSLRPEDVMAFVFWSRNYQPLLPYLDALDRQGYGGYFHFTITGYGSPLDRFTPPAPDMIRVFRALSDHYSPGHMLWRFDPIILSTRTPVECILETFTRLAGQLRGYTERCYISFVDVYRKTRKNLRPLEDQGVQLFEPSLEERLCLTRQLVDIARGFDIGVYACCEPDLLQIPGVRQAHCVDPLLIQRLWPQKFQKLALTRTRPGCGCFASRDIGAYDTCVHGCVYCYANASYETARTRFRAHDPESPCLGESTTQCQEQPAKRMKP